MFRGYYFTIIDTNWTCQASKCILKLPKSKIYTYVKKVYIRKYFFFFLQSQNELEKVYSRAHTHRKDIYVRVVHLKCLHNLRISGAGHSISYNWFRHPPRFFLSYTLYFVAKLIDFCCRVDVYICIFICCTIRP